MDSHAALETANGVCGVGLPPEARAELFELYSTMRAAPDDYEPDILRRFAEVAGGLPDMKDSYSGAIPLGPRAPATDSEVGIHRECSFDVVYLTTSGYAAATIASLESLLTVAPRLRAAVTVYCADAGVAECMRERFGVTTREWCSGSQTLSMLTYRGREFNRVASLKPRILFGHLSRSRPVLYSDGDVIWHQDPSALMTDLMTGRETVGMAEDRVGGGVACTGVITACPSPGARQLFAACRCPPWCGDQASVNHALEALKVPWQRIASQCPVFTHHNGCTGAVKMQLMAEVADGGSGFQDKVHLLTCEFRVPPHTNTGYSGPWVEQAYYAHWVARGCPSGPRTYLPVFWTDVQVTAPQMMQRLERWLQGLPAGDYYTVIQHGGGPGVTIPPHLRLRTFCAGRRCDRDCHVIPLLKRELALGRGERDIPVSFTGTCSSLNDVDGVRSRSVKAFSPHGLVWHHGAGWEDVLRHSRYALCPRGWACSSFRLFEAIQAGSIPIVVWSRELVLPDIIKRLDWAVVMHVDEVERESGRRYLNHLFNDAWGTAARGAALEAIRPHLSYEATVRYIASESE